MPWAVSATRSRPPARPRRAHEDRRRREEIDARNELDSLAYQAEHLVQQLRDRLPVHEKARAEQLIGDARAALSEQAGLDRVRPLISDLQQILQALPAVAAQAAPTGGDANGGSASAADEDEAVIDAEFTRE